MNKNFNFGKKFFNFMIFSPYEKKGRNNDGNCDKDFIMIQDCEKEDKSFSISELHFEDEMKLKCSSCFKTNLLNSLINKEGRQF